MKKLLSVFLLIAFMFSVAGCAGVTVGPFSSLYLDSEDYDSAVQEVIMQFKQFEGCTMSKIGYVGDKANAAEAEVRGLAPEQVIVLTSTFTTDGEDHQNGLEPNHTYSDYKWILTRNTSAEPWILTDHGME